MPTIVPFRGLIYNPEKISDITQVVTPPYDQFGAEKAADFRTRSPYNIVNLISTYPTDDGDDPYQKASQLAQTWLEEQILIHDDGPAIYAYHQDFSYGHSEAKIRKGFIALVELEDYSTNGIMRHEQTFAEPMIDRLNLLESLGMSFGHIMMVYRDPKQTIDQLLDPLCAKTPDFRLIDDLGVLHMVWRVKDEKIITAVQAAIKQSPCMIADGHHRYEAARQHREKNTDTTAESSSNYTLATLINIEQENRLTLLPTHRLIKNTIDINLRQLLQRMNMYFNVIDYDAPALEQDFLEDLRFESYDGQVFGLYVKDSDKLYLLRLKDQQALAKLFGSTPEVLQAIDTCLLHEIVLTKFLDIPSSPTEPEKYVAFERDPEEALRKVKEDDYSCCFLMNASRIQDVFEVGQAGHLMPQKSTDFYPKLMSGIIGQDLHPTP